MGNNESKSVEEYDPTDIVMCCMNSVEYGDCKDWADKEMMG